MSIEKELQKERKDLLLLRSDAYIEHSLLNDDHSIGTKEDCKVCQIYNQIRRSDEFVIKTLEVLHEDNEIIREFNQVTRSFGRTPEESEFNQSEKAIERFGTWSNFLLKVKNSTKINSK